MKTLTALQALKNLLQDMEDCGCIDFYNEQDAIGVSGAVSDAREVIKREEPTLSPRYIVDGHEFDNEESAFMGGGQYAPFVVFDIEAQDNLPGEYPTREEAQKIADEMNAKGAN